MGSSPAFSWFPPWGTQTSFQPKAVEHLYPTPSFQGGECSHAKTPLERRGHDGQDRLEGRLLCVADKKKYLRFRQGRETCQFNCLPLVLSCAPWIYTKITKAVTAVLQEMGIRLIVYTDDMFITAKWETFSSIRSHSRNGLPAGKSRVRGHLSILPKRAMEYLGLQVDSSSMELKLPGNKTKSIQRDATKILVAKEVTALEVSRLLGMNATTKAIATAPLFFLLAAASGAPTSLEQLLSRLQYNPLPR